jgi:hypothetical protein
MKMKKVRCPYCKDSYELKEGLDNLACPDCIDIYYQLRVDGTYEKREEPWTGNDLGYRKTLQPVTHRGKYKDLA